MRSALIFSLLLSFTLVATADNSPSPPKPNPAPQLAKSESHPSYTNEREAAALAFVSAHHPELKAVLEQLKSMQRSEYESAVRQLFQASEQLARVKEQDEKRYEIELEQWKVKSRLQLLVARAGLSEDPGLEMQIRQLIAAQADFRIAKLELDRVRAAERVSKAEYILTKAKNERSTEIDKQLVNVMKGVNKARTDFRKRNKKPDAKADKK